MRFKRIGVVGAGVMGIGVAENLASTGHQVVLVDVSNEALEAARVQIDRSLRSAMLWDRDPSREDHKVILQRIAFTLQHEQLADVDFLVENSTERWMIKKEIYPRIDKLCPPECIFAANTSAISIARLAQTTSRPDKVIGMHFMNPVTKKKFVEVIRTQFNSEATLQASKDFLQQMGKEAILVNDKPGFVSNRVMMLSINEAIGVVQDEVASPRDVDEIFVKCAGHKMGPLATADLIGLDTILLTLDVLYESYGQDKYVACDLLRRMVDSGQLGRKSGRGFFEYSR
jgi:3-hydroxybutyryl-CoA dehydrogenase